MENKIYILLKDLPNAKAGKELSLDNPKCPTTWYSFVDIRGQVVKFAAYDVENMPEWFKLKEEKVWTDSDMIEFLSESTILPKEAINTKLEEFKLIKHQNQKI